MKLNLKKIEHKNGGAGHLISVFRRLFALAVTCFTLTAFSSCGTTSTAAGSSSKKDAYYEENIKDFAEYTLSNGIPVIFKKTTSSQIFVLRTVFEGGTPLVLPEKAGIEGLTLDLMFHGSKNYSYEDIQKLQYSMTFSMNDSAGRDYSVAGFKCLTKDLDTVLSVYADALLAPELSAEDFRQFMVNAKESLGHDLSDPSGQLGIELEKAAFAGTDYKSSPDITEQSISSITLEDVKKHAASLVDAKRMKIVVVAGLDSAGQKEIVSKLDNAFGSIPKGEYKAPAVRKIGVTEGTVKVTNAQAGSAAYALGIFDCPEKYDSDYIPFALSLMYLDDIFFSEVREKAGAVYSMGTGIVGGRQLLGAISAYKISDKNKIFGLIDQALKDFPDEKGVEEKLNQYKNKYITTIFGSSQNAAGVAANMISSMEYSGSYDSYLKRSAQVQAVTAKEILAVYKKYLARTGDKKENPIKWVIVSAD